MHKSLDAWRFTAVITLLIVLGALLPFALDAV